MVQQGALGSLLGQTLSQVPSAGWLMQRGATLLWGCPTVATKIPRLPSKASGGNPTTLPLSSSSELPLGSSKLFPN